MSAGCGTQISGLYILMAASSIPRRLKLVKREANLNLPRRSVINIRWMSHRCCPQNLQEGTGQSKGSLRRKMLQRIEQQNWEMVSGRMPILTGWMIERERKNIKNG